MELKLWGRNWKWMFATINPKLVSIFPSVSSLLPEWLGLTPGKSNGSVIFNTTINGVRVRLLIQMLASWVKCKSHRHTQGLGGRRGRMLTSQSLWRKVPSCTTLPLYPQFILGNHTSVRTAQRSCHWAFLPQIWYINKDYRGMERIIGLKKRDQNRKINYLLEETDNLRDVRD